MSDLANATQQVSSKTGGPRVPRRLVALLVIGVAAILAAILVRFSPWAQEYPLRNASLTTLRSWAAQNPRDPLLLYYLGTKAYNANSLAEAGGAFENAVSLDPKMVRAYVGLALVQRDIGQLPQAYASAKQAQQLAPNDLDIQFLVGTLVMRTSAGRAVPEFESVTQKAPRRADAWYWLGICLQQINQKGEAIASLKKAVSLEPKNPLYQRDLGHVLLEMNFFADARAALQKSLALNPDDPRTRFILGDTRLKMAQSDDDLREADALLAACENLLGRASEKDPDMLASAISKRGEIAQRLGQPKQALAHFKRARSLAPRTLNYLYQEAEAHRLVGDEAQSKSLMRLYSRLSAGENAAFQMMERIRQDPKKPELRLQLARLFVKNGDLARAINQYEYCLYLDPLQSEAKRELEALKKRHDLGQPAGLKGATPSATGAP